MALLHLAARWRALAPDGPVLHVATVDHGLRAESAAEAELVARQADILGLPHSTLAWVGIKPTTGLQAKAREARYRLLGDHARSLGARFVLTAHHADDQAETVLMRLGRGSGVAGLAAMARTTALDPDVAPGVTLVRPLLDCPKRDLLDLCATESLAFATDPSNEDPTFARVRLRRQAEAATTLGLDPPTLRRLARRMARVEAALELEVARRLAELRPVAKPGIWRADVAVLREAAPEIVQRLLDQVIIEVAGAGILPLERLERLADTMLAALQARLPFRGTLGGTLLAVDSGGTLVVTPEPRRRRGGPRPD